MHKKPRYRQVMLWQVELGDFVYSPMLGEDFRVRETIDSGKRITLCDGIFRCGGRPDTKVFVRTDKGARRAA